MCLSYPWCVKNSQDFNKARHNAIFFLTASEYLDNLLDDLK